MEIIGSSKDISQTIKPVSGRRTIQTNGVFVSKGSIVPLSESLVREPKR